MLKNMKIKWSLTMGFGITILLSLLTIFAALGSMGTEQRAYQDIIDNQVRASELINTIRINANVAARDVREMALDPSSADNATLKNDAYSRLSDAGDMLQEFRELYTQDDSLETSYGQALTEWGQNLPDIVALIEAGQSAEATSMLKNVDTPLLKQLGTLGDQLSENLDQAQTEAMAHQARYTLYAKTFILCLVLVSAVIVLLLAKSLIRGIVVPTEQVRTALVGFSEGKLDIPVEFEGKNELGEMCDALRNSQKRLSTVIGDICHLLEEMGRGNFDIRTDSEDAYVGDLSAVLKSIRVINANLSDTLAQIDVSAEQVSADSEQVSTGAQALAQGATMQASAVQQLSATIAEISGKSQNNAKSSEKAMEHSQNAGTQVTESAKYMDEMVEAMDQISKSSQEISKIIATIENIAFQTNILALNAAVEAARAGSAGKGFAVVADEVRNLATKSDQAAKATKELIDQSISSVQYGNEIVTKVSDSLGKTVEASQETMEAIQEIAKAVEEESNAISQVTEGIDQISSVVQTNSATSQESAAASEELSTQATLMKGLMSKFKLRATATESYPAAPGATATASVHTMTSEPVDDGSYGAGSVFSKY
jgi:methyl-accepting chemotaxis protein